MLGEIFGRKDGLICTELELVRFLTARPPVVDVDPGDGPADLRTTGFRPSEGP